MEPNLKDFLEFSSVYTLDVLGDVGLNVESHQLETNEQQAHWFHQVIAQLPERSIHLLGLSFGGWSATNLLLYYPYKVLSLILVDSVFVFSPLLLKMILASLSASVPIHFLNMLKIKLTYKRSEPK
ncbi:MAG: alpha/beta hydrolase [Lactobacillales bacterium]|jgi:pimeloyl-ACP methyl ester carboxylesterase|nr:alpha/beta hydrolase [Lactobacillales bacterium]